MVELAPIKRKRTQDQEEEIKKMDIEGDDNISDLSSHLEDMDIDEIDKEDTDILSERSILMDQKIQVKETTIEEEIRKRENIKSNVEIAKIAEKKVGIEYVKKSNKSRKQKSKDARKKVNKRKRIVKCDENEVLQVPNLKQVPLACSHLVNNGDVVYVVPGDGACCPNCAAAFFFQDEVFGTKLR